MMVFLVVVKEINSNEDLLCLTEMSVECENNLISHKCTSGTLESVSWKKIERVKDKMRVFFLARKGLGEGRGQYKR